MQKSAGSKLDQHTGTLETACVLDAISNPLQPVIGPQAKGVLVVTNIWLESDGQSTPEAVCTLNR